MFTIHTPDPVSPPPVNTEGTPTGTAIMRRPNPSLSKPKPLASLPHVKRALTMPILPHPTPGTSPISAPIAPAPKTQAGGTFNEDDMAKKRRRKTAYTAPRHAATPPAPRAPSTPRQAQSPVAHNELVAMELSVREAAIMLDRDLPRAVHIIQSKGAAYPNGYLARYSALLGFMQSAQMVAMLDALDKSAISTLPLKAQLPALAVPRTAELLSAIIVALDSAGINTFQTEQTARAVKDPDRVLIEIQNALHRLVLKNSSAPSVLDSAMSIPKPYQPASLSG